MKIPKQYRSLPVRAYWEKDCFINYGYYHNGVIHINGSCLNGREALRRTLRHEFLHWRNEKKLSSLYWMLGWRIMLFNVLFFAAFFLLAPGFKIYALALLLPCALALCEEVDVLVETRDFAYGVLKVGLLTLMLASCVIILFAFY